MIDFSTLLTYLAAATALVLAPGPGQMLVLTRCLSGGRRLGLLTSLGLNAATLVHTVAAALGLSAVLATSALAFAVVKYVGAAYLIYLGLRALRAGRAEAPATAAAPVSAGRALREAFVTGLLNPKVALFFLAFLPQFVRPTAGPVLVQFLVLGALLAALGFLWDAVLASTFATVGSRLLRNPRFALWRERVMGGVLLGLGLKLALAERK
ncbi:MAG TPA: LysE family translocator [Thermoanaerobaculia bacterium]|nr:LysE family translocator [Thermoanaerobaculia bacterium]